MADTGAKLRIYSVGHSNHPLDRFLQILHEHGIACVVDVRRFPTSNKHPHFKRQSLSERLPRAGIAYVWLGAALGGYRSGGYEAYLETDAFARGLAELEALAHAETTAFMCAEALYFRCHRRFIADRLAAKGWRVTHIMPDGRLYEHKRRAES